MNEEKLPMSDHGEQEDVMEENYMDRDMDELDQLIVCALAGLASPSVQCGADPTSKTDDESAAAASAVSRKSGARVLPKSREDTPPWKTCQADRETVPGVDRFGFRNKGESPHENRALIAAYEAFQEKEQVGWGYEFRVKEVIGSGGQGVVYRIECLDRFYGARALKVFSPRPYGSKEAYETDMRRMESIAEIVHQNGHNNLLEVEHFKPHGDVFVMVMKLIDGFDLEHLLQSETVNSLKNSIPTKDWDDHSCVVYGPSDGEQWGLKPCIAVNIIQQCLRGVSALHNKERDRDIVHCDIKPSNIMIDCNGAIKLIDIGSAYKQLFPPQHISRTWRYVPPEVLKGGQWTAQSDLASLGYVLIELLSGRPEELVKPVDGKPAPKDLPKGSGSVCALSPETRASLAETKSRLHLRLAELIPARARDCEHLIRLCNKLIHPNLAERFATAEDAIFGLYGTYDFQSELHRGMLAAYCPKYMECWVNYAKIAQAKTAQSVS